MAAHGVARKISRSLVNCELSHLGRQPIKIDLAIHQHAEYVSALQSAGVEVTALPEDPGLPDSPFVEDTMVVLDELVIVCRLGTLKREPEAEKNLGALNKRCQVQRILPPGTLEGGDVLRVGRKLFVGCSRRTNQEGIEQLRQIVIPYGYQVIPVAVRGCLHLKTGITSPTEGLFIANPDWVDLAPFAEWEILLVPKQEPWAANTLPVNGRTFVIASALRTAEMLISKGISVHAVDISEIQKAEAGLTCLSVLYET